MATHGADWLGFDTSATLTAGFSVHSNTSNLKLQADGAVDGEGQLAVINGFVALEVADTGDQWAPHRFARCCDCAYFLAKLLQSAPGSSQMITGIFVL